MGRTSDVPNLLAPKLPGSERTERQHPLTGSRPPPLVALGLRVQRHLCNALEDRRVVRGALRLARREDPMERRCSITQNGVGEGA